jgi:glycine/D-amino acid oxidase-like deaminating enzyme
MGSATELLADLARHSEEEVVSLFIRRKEGLDLLRRRLDDRALGYQADGAYELIAEADLPALERLDYLNDLLRPSLGCDAFRTANERIAAFGFSGKYVAALIENTCEGSIHSGQAMRSLIELASSKGVEIKTGAAVTRFAEDEAAVTVEVASPYRKDAIPMKTSTLTICTNAFARQLLPKEDVIPGRGQVLITQPVPGLRLKGIYHYDAGYYYFREIDGRMLIGGGRNLDFEGERTTDISLSGRIQQDLEDKLRNIILPGQPFEVDMRWSGIMAFGAAKAPIVRAFSDRIFGAFRMGGMGVALGSGAAREVVRLLAGRRH